MAQETKSYVTSLDVRDNILSLFTNPQQESGYSIGFLGIEKLYNILPGCTTYITGIPSHGKSEFLFDILVFVAQEYGWRCAIFSPETGSAADIYRELIQKWTQKSIDRRNSNCLTENELYRAVQDISEYFYIIGTGIDSMSVQEFYKTVDLIEKTEGKKIHLTVIDPWNEVAHDFSPYGGREDKYLEFHLGYVRRNARENNRHNIIVAHPKGLIPNKKNYYDPPTAYMLSGGAAWFAKADSILCIWRPPYGENDETGRPYADNETHVIVQKAKPKYIGQKGTAVLFYNRDRFRYYEIDCLTGFDRYAKTDQEYIEQEQPQTAPF